MKFDFIKSTASLSFGSAMARGISVLTPLVLTKFYSPHSVGQYSFVVLTASITAIFFTLRSESLLIAVDEDQDAEVISSLAIKSTLILGTVFQILSIALYLIGAWPFFTGFLVIPTVAMGISLFQISREIRVRQELYLKEAALYSTCSILNFLGQFLLGLSNYAKFTGLILPKIVTDFYYVLSTLNKSHFVKRSKESIEKVVAKYKALCLQLFVGRLLINVSNNSISLYWPLFFSFESLGLVYLSLKITQLPGNILGENLSKVFERSFVQGKIKNFKKSLALVFGLMLILSLVATATIYFLLDPVLAFVGNAAWREASFFSVLFSPIIFTTIVSAGLASCFKLSNRVNFLNSFDLLEGILKNISVISVGYLYSNNPMFMILTYSWMTLIFCLLKTAYVFLRIPNLDFKAL